MRNKTTNMGKNFEKTRQFKIDNGEAGFEDTGLS
jgi:hypothetical protein